MRLVFRRACRAAVLTYVAFVCIATATAGQAPRTEAADAEATREQWQKVPEIFGAMGVSPGDRVADVGAGSGFFTVRLARAVGPDGRVFAVEINPGAVRDLQERVARERLDNVEVIAADAADPRLPAPLDAVLIVNAYHEMAEPLLILDKIRQALKLGGRLVIVEPIAQARLNTSRAQQWSNHEIAMDFVVQDLGQAGFTILERRERFVENLLDRDIEWLIVATPQY